MRRNGLPLRQRSCRSLRCKYATGIFADAAAMGAVKG